MLFCSMISSKCEVHNSAFSKKRDLPWELIRCVWRYRPCSSAVPSPLSLMIFHLSCFEATCWAFRKCKGEAWPSLAWYLILGVCNSYQTLLGPMFPVISLLDFSPKKIVRTKCSAPLARSFPEQQKLLWQTTRRHKHTLVSRRSI